MVFAAKYTGIVYNSVSWDEFRPGMRSIKSPSDHPGRPYGTKEAGNSPIGCDPAPGDKLRYFVNSAEEVVRTG